MYRLNGIRPEDIAALSGKRVILPGTPEPEWLRRSAEHERELPLLRAEQRDAEQAPEPKAGLVARLRLALGRA